MVRPSWARSNDGPPSSYVGFPASLRRSAAAAAEAKSWRVAAEILPLAAAPRISPLVRYSRKWSVTPFRIQAIAQQSELHAALAERDLAGQVISGERVGRDVGLEHARVQDPGDPDRFRSVDDIVWWTTRCPPRCSTPAAAGAPSRCRQLLRFQANGWPPFRRHCASPASHEGLLVSWEGLPLLSPS